MGVNKGTHMTLPHVWQVMLNRTNSITGVPYREDPTILANFGDGSGDSLQVRSRLQFRCWFCLTYYKNGSVLPVMVCIIIPPAMANCFRDYIFDALTSHGSIDWLCKV